jgi:phage-related protein (TIGR01555 family)
LRRWCLKTEKLFGLRRKMLWAMTRARLYGGAVIIMGIKGQNFEDELKPESVGKDDLAILHVVARWSIAAGPIVRDITSPYFGEPSYYERSNVMTPPSPGGVQQIAPDVPGVKRQDVMFIHPSRVIKLIGADYPNVETAPDAWGDSTLQVVNDAIRDAAMTSASVAAMVSEAKLDIFKVPGLTNAMSTTDGSAKMTARFSSANAAKSVVNALLLDTAEEFVTRNLRVEGYDKVMAMFLMIACGAADVPATRLIGREPAGQNATGESDLRNYYDRLSADQEVRISPLISPMDEVLIRTTFGDRDPSIFYNWSSLWQESEEVRLEGMDKVLAMFLMIACGAADVPATRLIGREPAGQNATGESDLRNYYDRLSADQEVRMSPLLSPLDEVLIRTTFGDRDESIYYNWASLWQESEEVKTQSTLRKAQSFAIDVNSGILDRSVLSDLRRPSMSASGLLVCHLLRTHRAPSLTDLEALTVP